MPVASAYSLDALDALILTTIPSPPSRTQLRREALWTCLYDARRHPSRPQGHLTSSLGSWTLHIQWPILGPSPA